MLISTKDINNKFNNICLYLLVITTLIGPMVYVGFASLYHFVVFGLFLLVLYKGINTANFKTDIMTFLTLWLVESVVSVLWAPNKMIAFQYVYYIFLFFACGILFHSFLTKENLVSFTYFMVVVLLLCNVIAFWEVSTGNHLVEGYLGKPIRLRLLKHVPGGFYMNPNDFATFIIQAIPFSFAGLASKKIGLRVFSAFNLVASFVTVCATQSRAQILLLLAMYLFFALIFHKKDLIKMGVLICALAALIYYTYPDFADLINGALKSVSGESLVANVTTEGGSLNVRINLLKNAGHILLDTFGFGIGAGCHRVVMAEYSIAYFDTRNILVMHNLLGELFVDYGVLIGTMFLITLGFSCYRLIMIYKSAEEKTTRTLASLLAFSLATFILCGASSSSILQLTSIWLTMCFTSAFIKLYSQN